MGTLLTALGSSAEHLCLALPAATPASNTHAVASCKGSSRGEHPPGAAAGGAPSLGASGLEPAMAPAPTTPAAVKRLTGPSVAPAQAGRSTVFRTSAACVHAIHPRVPSNYCSPSLRNTGSAAAVAQKWSTPPNSIPNSSYLAQPQRNSPSSPAGGSSAGGSSAAVAPAPHE